MSSAVCQANEPACTCLQMMITRSHEVMMLHLSSLFNSNAGLVGSPLLLAASATLQILTTLDMSSHDYVSKFTPQLVKLFHVIEREHTVQGSPQGSALSSNGPVRYAHVCMHACVTLRSHAFSIHASGFLGKSAAGHLAEVKLGAQADVLCPCDACGNVDSSAMHAQLMFCNSMLHASGDLKALRCCCCSIKAARGEPAYGTLLWVMCTVMQLCADRVLRSVEHKKTFLQAAMWLISGHSARMLTVQQQPGDVPREVTDVRHAFFCTCFSAC